MAGQQANEQTIYDYFYQLLTKVYHFGAAQAQVDAAGITANAQWESGSDPNAFNANEKASNIFQWENGRGAYGGTLANYAQAHGLTTNSLAAGLGTATQELQGGYSSTIDALRQATTPGQASNAWALNFEHNDPSSDPARANLADQIYAQITSGQPLTGGPTGSGVNLTSFLTGSSKTTPAPYPDLSLKAPLNPDQRAAIKKWLLDNLSAIQGSDNGQGLGHLLNANEINSFNDQALLNWYHIGLSATSNDPVQNTVDAAGNAAGAAAGAVGSAVADAITSVIKSITAPLAKYLADAGMVIFGVILLVAGIYLVASSRGNENPPAAAAPAAKKSAPAEAAEAAE